MLSSLDVVPLVLCDPPLTETFASEGKVRRSELQ